MDFKNIIKLSKWGTCLSALAVISSVPSIVSATSIGYDLAISGNINMPRFLLTNTSSEAKIDSFRFTIGDEDRNFDGIRVEEESSENINYDLRSPDIFFYGGARSDEIFFEFSDFNPGNKFQFVVDIDRDLSGDSFEDYRFIFANAYNRPNAVASVTFDNDELLSFEIPNGMDFDITQREELTPLLDPENDLEPIIFPNENENPDLGNIGTTGSTPNPETGTNSVPTPATLVLASLGLAIMGFMRRRGKIS